MPYTALKDHKLESISYWPCYSLFCLSFNFTNGITSPPIGTYRDEATEWYYLPYEVDLSKIIFGTTTDTLASVELHDRNGTKLTEIIDIMNPKRYSGVILRPNEKVVAAKFRCSAQATTSI